MRRVVSLISIFISILALSFVLCLLGDVYPDEWICMGYLDIIFYMLLLFELEYERNTLQLSNNSRTDYLRFTFALMIIPLSFQYVFVDGLTALECPKTGLALSVTRKSLFVISAAVLPSFFGAKAAFFAEPVADGISSVLSTIVFLTVINKLQKNSWQD